MLRPAIRGVVVAFLASTLLCSPATARQKAAPKPAPKPHGVKWEWKVFDAKNKLLEEGTFLAHDFKILKGTKQIGTYKDVAEGHVKVSIKEGRLMGDLDLRLTPGTPPLWKGEIKRKDGSVERVSIEFITVK